MVGEGKTQCQAQDRPARGYLASMACALCDVRSQLLPDIMAAFGQSKVFKYKAV